MMPRIAILAALPREVAPLTRDWPLHKSSRADGWTIAENDRTIAVCAGMGKERVKYAFQLAIESGPLTAIFSVGYAGALRPEIKRNSVFWPSRVVDAATGESFSCNGGSGTLATADRVIDAAEKLKMATRWNADLVDMETAAIASLSQAQGLAFRSTRVVSDELGDTLPDLNGAIDRNGGIDERAMALRLAIHPNEIPVAIRFAQRSWQASLNLAAALRQALESAE